jgi:hypothetical protein
LADALKGNTRFSSKADRSVDVRFAPKAAIPVLTS